MEEQNKIEELLRRAKTTARSKYRACERLEQHHRFAQVSVALLACALLAIPMMQVFDVYTGYPDKVLNMVELTLAILILVYTLLLDQENFNTRSENMNRNGLELSSYARKLAGLLEREVAEAEYQSLVNQYYTMLEKSESHKTIDYMFIRLEHRPENFRDWLFYTVNTVKAYFWYFFLFCHYLLAIAVSTSVLYFIITGVFSFYHVID